MNNYIQSYSILTVVQDEQQQQVIDFMFTN